MAAQAMDQYLDNPDAFAGLSEEEQAKAFLGAQGDTGETPPEISETPAAETPEVPEAVVEETPPEPDPVVLAKDGKHTIPYQELETARASAAHWEQVAREATATLETLKAQPAAADIDVLEQQCFDATIEGDKTLAMDLRRQINAEIQRRAEVSALERVATQQAAEAERRAAEATEQAQTQAQTLFETQVAQTKQQYPFLDEASPAKNDQAISDVVEWRDYRVSQGDAPHEALAKAVAKFAPIYAPTAPPAQPAAPTVAQKAAAAIAKAKTPVPTSLSDIPAGTSAHHDEAAAVLEMGSNDLMAKFAGKTPEQIMELMSRVI